MVLSTDEHLVEYVFREGNRYTDLVQEQFAEKFPETSVPHRNALRSLTGKFRETGSVLDAERSGRPCKLNDKKLMDISGSILRSPSKSLSKLEQEKNRAWNTAQSGPRKIELLPIQKRERERVNGFRPV
jgi:transposase